MKATIRVPAALAAKILAQWRREDAGYYDSPHGYSPAPAPHEGRCGFTLSLGRRAGGRWISSAGNRAEIYYDENGEAQLVVEGRRHGIAALMGWTLRDAADLAELRAAPVESCDSTASWPWWQTRDDVDPSRGES